MSSNTPPNPANTATAGLTLNALPTSPHLIQKPSQASLTSASEPFPALEEKETRVPRPSDATTVRGANPFDTDIEAMISHESSDSTRKSIECTRGGTDCHVWPGQDHWKRKAKAARKNKHSCTCLQGLSKRNRILVKVLIGVLIVGIAVGVGFGVSKPLGAGIWRSETQNSP